MADLSKQPGEDVPYTFPFGKRMPTGVTVDSVDLVSQFKRDSSLVYQVTSDLTLSTPVISGSDVQVFIAGGVHTLGDPPTQYKIEAKVTGSDGGTYEIPFFLPVEDK